MSRIEKLAQGLASLIARPADALEVGGLSSQLYDILKIQTHGNYKLREKVHEWLDYYIEAGLTTIPEYINDINEAYNDYDIYFYDTM